MQKTVIQTQRHATDDAIILSFVVYNAFIYSPKSRHKQQILMLKTSIEVKLQL